MEENEQKEKGRMCEVSCKTPTGPRVAHCATLAKCLPDKLLWLAACSENSMKQDLGVQE